MVTGIRKKIRLYSVRKKISYSQKKCNLFWVNNLHFKNNAIPISHTKSTGRQVTLYAKQLRALGVDSGKILISGLRWSSSEHSRQPLTPLVAMAGAPVLYG